MLANVEEFGETMDISNHMSIYDSDVSGSLFYDLQRRIYNLQSHRAKILEEPRRLVTIVHVWDSHLVLANLCSVWLGHWATFIGSMHGTKASTPLTFIIVHGSMVLLWDMNIYILQQNAIYHNTNKMYKNIAELSKYSSKSS